MTLYVHVGRGKAGSSTLQKFAFENRLELRRLGLVYPEFGSFRSGHLPLSQALRSGQPDQRPLRELHVELAANPGQKYLISSEHLFHVRRQTIENLVGAAGGHEIRVIAYVRDYAAWIRSIYAQRTRSGRNASDFDAFFSARTQGLSALPGLRGWAAVLGWKSVRVRSLDPDNLSGGKLTRDLFDAVGIAAPDPLLPEPADQNITPPWPVIELHRAINELRAEPDATYSRAAEKRLARHLLACIGKHQGAMAQADTLTAEQARFATDLYNRDVGILNARTGSNIPALRASTVAERPFLPSFAAVSPELRRAFVRRLAVRLALARILPTRDRRHRDAMKSLLDRLGPGSDSSAA